MPKREIAGQERIESVVVAAAKGLDRRRTRLAVEQMRAIGGDLAILGAMIAERVDALPDERKLRRDAAIVVLAETFDGKPWTVAGAIASEIRRYGASAWNRRDCRLAAAPLEYGSNPRKLALFALMREGGDGAAIGQKQIAKILRKRAYLVSHCSDNESHGTGAAVASSIGCLLTPNSAEKRAKNMNVATKPEDFQLLAALARQPANQKLLAGERARTVADRQACVDRIKALDVKAEAEWPAGQAAIKAAATKVREAERRLREANDALAAAHAAASNASHAYTVARQAEEAALIAGADVATIDAWRRELCDEMDALQRRGALIAGESVEKHPVTRKEIRRGYSNAPSVRARIAAALAAFHAVDLLKLEPDQARLPEIIAELRASLPKVNQNPEFESAPV